MGEEVEKEKGPSLVDVSALDIYPILGFFINILSAKAWQYMGLQVDPKTKKILKDFDKATLTIDCIAFLIDKLTPELGEDDGKRLKTLLTDLQINYVRQRKAIQK